MENELNISFERLRENDTSFDRSFDKAVQEKGSNAASAAGGIGMSAVAAAGGISALFRFGLFFSMWSWFVRSWLFMIDKAYFSRAWALI